MTTYNTGNPLGSSDPRDLYDNAENLDAFVNDKSEVSHPDRLDKPRKTWHGIESEFNASQADREDKFNQSQIDRGDEWQEFLLNQGFQDVGQYEAGLELTAYNQVFTHEGEGYRLGNGTILPFIASGDFIADSQKFVKVQFVTSAMLRAEELARQAGDANLQAQISGGAPLEASAFSPISWHGQIIENSVNIPDNVNAWSFGPTMTIAAGQSVTIGTGSSWTIANGEMQ